MKAIVTRRAAVVAALVSVVGAGSVLAEYLDPSIGPVLSSVDAQMGIWKTDVLTFVGAMALVVLAVPVAKAMLRLAKGLIGWFGSR